MSTIEFPSRTGVWWTSDSRPIAEVRRSAAELEQLGYGSLWFGEAYGKESFTQAAALLGATERLAVGTGIANIHARDALAAEAGGRTLSALVVEQSAVLTGDRETARRRAHWHLEIYSGLPNYRNNWKRLGFTDEDMPRGGSDRLKDALVAWGDEEAIAARVREHFDAGADHVCVQLLGEDLTADPLPDLRRLAPALPR